MPLHLYNTLAQEKQVFQPAQDNTALLYTCGPTVYSDPHIGNLRSYVFADTLRRTLIRAGFGVRMVMNLTDVGHLTQDSDDGEDKVERAAHEQGVDAYALADRHIAVFKQNLVALNIVAPDIWARATGHIQEQIDLVQNIEDAGYAYRINDGIYFDTGKLPAYGKLARLDLSGLKAGARVEVNPEKHNPTDFALWKFSPTDAKRQMEWDSPWGKGFPGWHVECTAMSVKYLGPLADIHTGGVDHIPIHHTNEIAQATAAYKTDEARFWMHNEFLITNTERMGKSEGNALTLAALVEKGYSPLAYRYFLLGTHYRQKITFSWEAMSGAQAAYEKLTSAVQRLASAGDGGCPEFEEQARTAMEDDLNTPRALAVLWEVLKSDTAPAAKRRSVLWIDEYLGLGLAGLQSANPESIVTALLEERETARNNKEFEKADTLRKEIEDAGFVIEDTPNGPRLLPK